MKQKFYSLFIIFKIISSNFYKYINTSKLIIFVFSILFACGACDESKSSDSVVENIIDRDRDGYEATVDCNDINPFTHPDAPEMGGDDIDNNCNGTRDEEEIVEFSDNNLKKAVIESLQLNKKEYDDIYNYEMSELKSLIANNKEIFDLKGLEYAHNIIDLDLSNNLVNNLLPLIHNPGIKGRDVYVNVDYNLLDERNCPEIQTLVNRDIHIYYDVPCDVFLDMDEDGFSMDEDCDDRDEFSYPGAPELGLDGKDNNCNGTIDEEEIVNFNEYRIKTEVIAVLSKNHGIEKESSDEIYNYEIAKIKSLDLIRLYIKDLKGLEYAYNLQKLNIENNKIDDLSPIKGLRDLRELYATKNNLSTIWPLAGLKNLIHLNLSENSIYDISALKKMYKLQELYLSKNEIVNIPDLEKKTDLRILHLDKNWIIDILPLKNLTFLIGLKLQNNNIINISSLEKLTQLEDLDLSNNKIEDISSLAGCVNLKSIALANNLVDEVESLEELTSLEYLDLDSNDIYYIDELRDLTNLKYLSMVSNGVWDLTPLYYLKKLETINLEDNFVEEIDAFSEMKNLKWLNLENNYIDDLSPLIKLSNLEHLNIDYNGLDDISPLAELASLKYLSLNDNHIKNINAVSSLTQVEELKFENNSISDISSLEFVVNIKLIDLDGNHVSDVKALVNNPGISGRNDKIYLRNNLLDSDDCKDIMELIDRKVYFAKDFTCN